MKKNRVNLSFILFAASDSKNFRSYAFYIALKKLSHEGSIHNYKSIIPNLTKKLDCSESLFRFRLKECFKLGIIRKEGNHIVFKSHIKVINEIKQLYPNAVGKTLPRKFYTDKTTYKDTLSWFQAIVIQNNFNQQLYNEKVEAKKIGGKYHAEQNISALIENCQVSRKGIALLLNRKSATSGSNAIKRLKKSNFISFDEKVIKRIMPMSMEMFRANFDRVGKFFIHNGYLWENKCNRLQLKLI